MLLPTASCAAALLLSGALGLHHPKPQHRDTDETVSSELSTRKSDISDFSVQQVRNENYRKKSGLLALLDVYAKYQVPLTHELKVAMKAQGLPSRRKRQSSTGETGTTSATPPQGYDYEFLCPVNIGTPAQTLNLNFDSGSSDLWVFSTDTNGSDVNGQGLYDPSASRTSVLKQNYTFSIGYGDGNTASGIVYTDVVSVGNAAVAGMAVEAATQVSQGFTDDVDSEGLFGLGMSVGNTVQPVKQQTFLDTIKNALTAPLFTADLLHTIPGSYDFGYIDATKHTGYIQYGSVLPGSIYWESAVTGYRVGAATNSSNPSDGFVMRPWRTIADTGTTLLLVPDDVVTAYYAQVDGSVYDDDFSGMTFPCNEADTLPDFTFGVGLYKGVLPGSYVNYGNVDADNIMCFGGIQTQGNMDFGIFGDVMLKAQFVVFDQGNQRIGFANKDLTT